MPNCTLAATTIGLRKTKIREYPMPEIPPDAGLLKIEGAGVCGTDSRMYNADRPHLSGRRNRAWLYRFRAFSVALDGDPSIRAGGCRSGDSLRGRRGNPRRDPCYCVAVAEIAPNPLEANPGHIVTVTDFSRETLRNLVAHLEVSTSFEHLVYREAELDAIWSITGFFLASENDLAKRDALLQLHRVAHQAHDLVGQGRPMDAAGVLRALL